MAIALTELQEQIISSTRQGLGAGEIARKYKLPLKQVIQEKAELLDLVRRRGGFNPVPSSLPLALKVISYWENQKDTPIPRKLPDELVLGAPLEVKSAESRPEKYEEEPEALTSKQRLLVDLEAQALPREEIRGQLGNISACTYCNDIAAINKHIRLTTGTAHATKLKRIFVITGKRPDLSRAHSLKPFSPKEWSILELLSDGMDRKQISASLNLSQLDIKNLLAQIKSKLPPDEQGKKPLVIDWLASLIPHSK